MTQGSAPTIDVRLAALRAVDADVVRRAERIADLRLCAAVLLAPTLCIAEALLLGAAVAASRLDQAWTKRLSLSGDVLLDLQLAARVVAHAPLAKGGR